MKELSSLVYITWSLARRDIAARYRRSALGLFWAVLQPLLLMTVFTFLRAVVNIPSDGIPYVIFSYAALVPWLFFANGVTRAGQSVLSNANLIKKSPVPREIFPLAAVATALFDFCMSGIVLAAMMVYYRVQIGAALVWLPALILITAALAFGIGMLVAAIGCFKQDIIFAASFGMQLWLYATPVIYPASSVPAGWQWQYRLNPMVGIIEGFRNVLIKNTAPDAVALACSVIVTVCLLAAVLPVFRRMSQYFADVL